MFPSKGRFANFQLKLACNFILQNVIYILKFYLNGILNFFNTFKNILIIAIVQNVFYSIIMCFWRFVPGWIICIRKSNKILIKISLTVSCVVVVVFLNAKIYVFALYKMAFHFLIFNLERHQREDSARDSCNGSFLPWKSLNFSIQ